MIKAKEIHHSNNPGDKISSPHYPPKEDSKVNLHNTPNPAKGDHHNLQSSKIDSYK